MAYKSRMDKIKELTTKAQVSDACVYHIKIIQECKTFNEIVNHTSLSIWIDFLNDARLIAPDAFDKCRNEIQNAWLKYCNDEITIEEYEALRLKARKKLIIAELARM